MMNWQVIEADVLDWSAGYDGPKFHAMLCDPPYELGFMSRDWDKSGIAFRPETWAALAQHLHPGAFVMAFASTRGYHRLAVAMEDSGLIIQPSLFIWANAQAFPKSTRINVGKASGPPNWSEGWTLAEINEAWQGHRYGGQILKNCAEPVICAQVPWTGKRLDCIVDTGAGALNVDGGRIAANGNEPNARVSKTIAGKVYNDAVYQPIERSGEGWTGKQGRWPANFTLQHDPGCQRVGVRKVSGDKRQGGGSGGIWSGESNVPVSHGYDGETVADWRCTESCPVRRLGEQSEERPSGGRRAGESWITTGEITGFGGDYAERMKQRGAIVRRDYVNDTGTAARFFHQSDWSYEIAERLALADPVRYQSKASRRERDAGLEDYNGRGVEFKGGDNRISGKPKSKPKPVRNPHPCLKPIALARWLATLLLPPPEYAPRRLLVPFGGTNSEGIGGLLAGWDEVAMVDNNAEYCHIAKARTKWWAGWSKQADTAEPKDILKAGKDQPEPNNEQLELL